MTPEIETLDENENNGIYNKMISIKNQIYYQYY
jgi:hypothetical protein